MYDTDRNHHTCELYGALLHAASMSMACSFYEKCKASDVALISCHGLKGIPPSLQMGIVTCIYRMQYIFELI